MKMPNGHLAVVTDEKLFGYLLNEEHPTNPGHAELFRILLGIEGSNAEPLRIALLTAAANEDATPGDFSPFGEKFEIRFAMTGLKGTYTILSVWIIADDRTEPRLVTAFIE